MTAKREIGESRASQTAKTSFTSTRWTMVLAARDLQEPGSRAALAQLCQTYWYPLYAYARRYGQGPQEAEDVVQDFFLALIEKDFLKSVDPEKGKFRSFLLVALKNFMANEWDKKRALKRGAAYQFVFLDAEMAGLRHRDEPYQAEAPDAHYDRLWAQTVLAQALDALRKEYFAAGKRELLQALECHLDGPPDQSKPYAETAARFGLSVSGIKMAVKRMRKRYGELLRKEIRHTLRDPSEIDEEIRYLAAVLASNERHSGNSS